VRIGPRANILKTFAILRGKLGINIQIDVGTISYHSWDNDSFVDVYPGPFLITSGTIWDHMSWSFFS